ncbi:MAG: PD40 domain-containing protein, partial [Prolixibacteraceae bacterium]|nr:PD40 domain-containing protein [Prolixibacteraceae bacterium]
MKKLTWIVLLVMAGYGCTKKETVSTSPNYIPETPTLNSDIMTPEVLWSFGRLGETVISPDGETVAYTIAYYNLEENKGYSDIYTIPVGGGEAKKITNTTSNESNVVWRPDGKKIGYLSSASGSTQLWEMNPDGSNKNQVSDIEGGVAGFDYSPDMSKIYYLANVKLDENIYDLFPDLPKANARLENDIMYRHWDTWHDYTYSHIFIADYSNGKLGEGKDIMEGEKFDSPMKPFGGTEQIAWSTDGKTLAYTCKKKVGKEYSVSTNSDIYFYEVETGNTINFTSGMMGYDQNPVFSPDGKYIAWESMER